MRFVLTVTAFALAGATLATAAALPKDKALTIMHDRHEGMETIGKNVKQAKRELEAGSPDMSVLRASAGTIRNLSRKASNWFPAGTGPDVGKTGAKPAIWQNPKDFTAKLHSFQVAATAFNSAVASGNVAAAKARFADLGGTCKACHDTYRAEMKH